MENDFTLLRICSMHNICLIDVVQQVSFPFMQHIQISFLTFFVIVPPCYLSVH